MGRTIWQQFRSACKRGGERFLVRFLYRLPLHGHSVFADIKRALPNRCLTTIFDVGANVGQSASRYSKLVPGCSIYCFEPVSDTYETLRTNTSCQKSTHVFCMALGSSCGEATVVASEYSEANSLKLASVGNTEHECSEVVTIGTVDIFCVEHQIHHIDFLKIDTEGYDLEVLKGARRMLREKRISFVQVEAGMNYLNKLHVPFEELKAFLEQNGYVLFGIYEQTLEWTGQARLRFANPVFIEENAAERLRG